ncbi:MAG: DNA translocase FtsK [Odoribacter sp.]|nr:DNA translocase FtsK [Odoribacter sp.]
MDSTNQIDITTDSLGSINNAEAIRHRTKTTRPKAKPQPSQRPPRKGQGETTSINPIVAFCTAKRTRLALGVILTAISITILIVTISFLKTGVADQSVVEGSNPVQIVESGQTVENLGGPIGAYMSHALMVDGLGIGSFVTVIYIGVLALSLFGIMRCRFWAFTFKCLFTAISLSIILGLFTYNAETAFHWGGNHGRYVNQWLCTMGGVIGAYIISLTLASLLIVMYLNQLRSFYLNISGHVAKARRTMSEAAAQARRPITDIADVPSEQTSEKVSAQSNNTSVQPVDSVNAKAGVDSESLPQSIGFTIDDTPATTSASPKAIGEPEFTINPLPDTDSSAPSSGENLIAPFSIRDELSHYTFPTIDLLIDRPVDNTYSTQEQEENKNLITKTLLDYGIGIARIEATIGPTVTLYEIVPADGVRISQIRRLEDDIARSLEALGIRIIAPIRGKGTVGIEVPNRNPQIVSMRSVINSREFRECRMELPMALGATISNKIFITDLAKMPHLLVAGATGQGKSVGLNCIIASLLYKKHPGELKFVLIDPKMVEFSLYARIEKHYLAKLPDEEEPVITEPSKALSTLSALCVEMDNRYDLLKKAGVRNIVEYNDKFTRRVLNPEKGHRFMPYMVIIVDEFADLIMVAGKDISTHIARIAQKARAVGMHMIIATQRPSTDVITGMIKANFPARIAFRVAQGVDSKTILDCTGAQRLIGRGDMLFSHNSMMERVQCAFIDTPEVEALADFISRQTAYPDAYLLPEPENDKSSIPGAVDLSKRDELFDDCARFVVQNPTASTSSLQRRFSIGYNKAGKIMDQLEAAGIVGAADGQKPRAVLVDSVALEAMLRSL